MLGLEQRFWVQTSHAWPTSECAFSLVALTALKGQRLMTRHIMHCTSGKWQAWRIKLSHRAADWGPG